MVETVYNLVFVQQVNPYNGRPYLLNPQIETNRMQPSLVPHGHPGYYTHYQFSILYDAPGGGHEKSRIYMLLTDSRESLKGLITVDDYLSDMRYNNTKKFKFPWKQIKNLNKRDILRLLQIWISIARPYRRAHALNMEFDYRLNAYKQTLVQDENAMEDVSMSDVPSEEPYLTTGLSTYEIEGLMRQMCI
jgi:hypothetical protein